MFTSKVYTLFWIVLYLRMPLIRSQFYLGSWLSYILEVDRVKIMSHEAVLAVLPGSKEEAKSLKEVAQAVGIEVYTYADWIRAERSLARVLRILVKWGWVDHDRMQRDNGHKFWYNIYWKTELAVHEETSSDDRDMVQPRLRI